jgi:tellurite resistance protein TehA-like permease
MLIAVEPPAFTALASISMANAWTVTATFFRVDGQAKAHMLELLTIMVAGIIWGFSILGIAVINILVMGQEMTFYLDWWALMFPNIGFTLVTIKIERVLENVTFGWVGSVTITCLGATCLFGVAMCARAVLGQKIISKGKNEDT